MESNNTFYVIDGYGLIYRAYFAFINRPMTDADGQNISAIFGFFRMFFSIFKKEQPTHLVVAMDSIGLTFRHVMYDQYKANREKTPDDLQSQIPMIEEILTAAGIPVIRKNGMEADDVIATLVKAAEAKGMKSVIVSSDKDLLQLVSSSVSALRPVKGDLLHVDRDAVYESFGVWPEQIVDYLSLIGDTADNVPGVRGIGPKGAVKLLAAHQSLEGVYEHIAACTPSIRKKLEENRDTAFLSKRLVILDDRADVCCDIDSFTTDKFVFEKMIPFFQRIGSKGLIVSAGGSYKGKMQGSRKEQKDDKLLHQLQGKGRYRIIASVAELAELIPHIREVGIFALDIETDDIDQMRARPVGFSISFEARSAYYIPLIAGGRSVIDADVVRELLRPLLEDPGMRIIGQNIKYDYTVLRRWGITLATIYFDTMIAAWLLDANAITYNMDKLAEVYLDYTTTKFSDVVPKGSLFPEIELTKASDYAAEDADITYRLYLLFAAELDQRGMKKLFHDIEMPILRILADMEFRGMKLLPEKLNGFGLELTERLEGLEQKIYTECGKTFNVRSTKQLQTILFEDRGLTPVKKTKTGYSTDTSVLEELAKIDVIPQWILEHRGLTKLKNTYVDTLPKLIDPQTGRIHTSFVQTGTATGRLSSRNPNLQNIPIRSDDGRRIRSAFVPQDGYVFLSADYAQIELVVLAHYADDPGLKEAFISGGDVHRHTGSLIFNIPPEEVSNQQRRIAKTINFGVMYGMSPFRLSRELDISRKQAVEFIDSYFARYSGIRRFIDELISGAEKTGSVKTLFGHERVIQGINSRNRTEKSSAERIAVNTPIQGSAADIMKAAMIAVDRRITELGLRSRLLLQVHDELIFEVPLEEIRQMKELVRMEMEHVVELKVPLRVSIETGESWGGMH